MGTLFEKCGLNGRDGIHPTLSRAALRSMDKFNNHLKRDNLELTLKGRVAV